jgi:N-acetyl-1-D-myo-inositol-2-amino-2-deoxy-alpha-D-glucopyranoside deacetylase
VSQAVAVVREVRPQVLITYDEIGGYGHPDHIMAHRVAMAAAEKAAQPDGEGEPWTIEKVYWTAIPKSLLQAGIDALAERGESFFEGVTSADDLPFGNPDEEITTVIDGTAYADRKTEAMRAHATQISVDGPFFVLSNNIGREVLAVEHFRLVRGELGSALDEAGHELDLFDGVTT